VLWKRRLTLVGQSAAPEGPQQGSRGRASGGAIFKKTEVERQTQMQPSKGGPPTIEE
jgi:hypothetical protein